ncbi:MAG TPA: glycosyltransferase family 39 protein, partial [Kofleriaceae bacterium]|nr:glycosyltransferase family 39 protein [Kofleriaceae bacterium]
MRARLVSAGVVTALIAWSIWQRWNLLAASPFPLGVDGYFYPVELRALLATGHLAYPASPLTFYLLAPFAALSDPITGAKLGAAVYGALIAAPIYAVGARLGGGRGAGLVAAALATTSLGSLYLTVEFVKNGIGLTVALGALWLVLRATERPTTARVVAAALAVVAAYASHKMAAALVVIVGVPAALAAGATHGALRGRRLLYAIAGVIVAAIVALALGAASPERFPSTGDLALGGALTSPTAHWTAPALALPDGELAL